MGYTQADNKGTNYIMRCANKCFHSKWPSVLHGMICCHSHSRIQIPTSLPVRKPQNIEGICRYGWHIIILLIINNCKQPYVSDILSSLSSTCPGHIIKVMYAFQVTQDSIITLPAIVLIITYICLMQATVHWFCLRAEMSGGLRYRCYCTFSNFWFYIEQNTFFSEYWICKYV